MYHRLFTLFTVLFGLTFAQTVYAMQPRYNANDFARILLPGSSTHWQFAARTIPLQQAQQEYEVRQQQLDLVQRAQIRHVLGSLEPEQREDLRLGALYPVSGEAGSEDPNARTKISRWDLSLASEHKTLPNQGIQGSMREFRQDSYDALQALQRQSAEARARLKSEIVVRYLEKQYPDLGLLASSDRGVARSARQQAKNSIKMLAERNQHPWLFNGPQVMMLHEAQRRLRMIHHELLYNEYLEPPLARVFRSRLDEGLLYWHTLMQPPSFLSVFHLALERTYQEHIQSVATNRESTFALWRDLFPHMFDDSRLMAAHLLFFL